MGSPLSEKNRTETELLHESEISYPFYLENDASDLLISWPIRMQILLPIIFSAWQFFKFDPQNDFFFV